MRTAFKYPLTWDNMYDSLNLPTGAKFLFFGLQNRRPYAWFEVETDAPKVRRRFKIYGTGVPLPPPNEAEWRATIEDDPFIWHLYEIF